MSSQYKLTCNRCYFEISSNCVLLKNIQINAQHVQAESVDMLSPFYSFSLLLHMWYTFTPEFLSIKIIKSLSPCTYYLIGQISTSV